VTTSTQPRGGKGGGRKGSITPNEKKVWRWEIDWRAGKTARKVGVENGEGGKKNRWFGPEGEPARGWKVNGRGWRRVQRHHGKQFSSRERGRFKSTKIANKVGGKKETGGSLCLDGLSKEMTMDRFPLLCRGGNSPTIQMGGKNK